MNFRHVRRYAPDGTFRSGEIAVAGERIAAAPSDADWVDGHDCYAIPGLIDLHFHGCMGYDFCDGTDKAITAIALHQAANGVAAICPATMTYPEERLCTVLRAAHTHSAGPREAALVGINLEGPFLSAAKKGAQNGAYLHAPDIALFHRLQQQAGGLIRLCDIAPEVPGAMEMIEAIAGGTRVSLAHTAADYETAREAFRRGARQITHLFNAMPPLFHRAPGVIGAAADDDRVTVELIADGIHVHPAMVRVAFRLFPGRVILISDSMRAAGLGDGAYTLGGQTVAVQGRRATLEDGTIAGSATGLLDCVRTAAQQMKIPLGQAVQAAATVPAAALGIERDYGALEPGMLANIVLLDDTLAVRAVMLRGQMLS